MSGYVFGCGTDQLEMGWSDGPILRDEMIPNLFLLRDWDDHSFFKDR